ncbi:synaptotagmin-like protein 1 [Acipenser ruthenus]|uniref:synaptotagmin-like protein 1 n=1 Tax=Acipenser ruthenus TaxID=7906 RepID=UPI0027417631|nr:synaptotagmin-like protein 1 [Acipenser ruthenus]
MLDLSYLSEEEHGYIMGVLIRNVSLKEKDTNRIRCLFRQLPADFGDERTQRLVTGSWFEEAKAMRYRDGLNGAELVLASLQRTSRAFELNESSSSVRSTDSSQDLDSWSTGSADRQPQSIAEEKENSRNAEIPVLRPPRVPPPPPPPPPSLDPDSVCTSSSASSSSLIGP